MERGLMTMIMNVVTTLDAYSFTVDKNKPKTWSRQQAPTSQAKPNHGPPKTVPPRHPLDDGSDQRIQNLGELLAASNCRFEAVSIVLQQALAEVG